MRVNHKSPRRLPVPDASFRSKQATLWKKIRKLIEAEIGLGKNARIGEISFENFPSKWELSEFGQATVRNGNKDGNGYGFHVHTTTRLYACVYSRDVSSGLIPGFYVFGLLQAFGNQSSILFSRKNCYKYADTTEGVIGLIISDIEKREEFKAGNRKIKTAPLYQSRHIITVTKDGKTVISNNPAYNADAVETDKRLLRIAEGNDLDLEDWDPVIASVERQKRIEQEKRSSFRRFNQETQWVSKTKQDRKLEREEIKKARLAKTEALWKIHQQKVKDDAEARRKRKAMRLATSAISLFSTPQLSPGTSITHAGVDEMVSNEGTNLISRDEVVNNDIVNNALIAKHYAKMSRGKYLTKEQYHRKRAGRKGYTTQKEKEIYYEGFTAAINLLDKNSNPYVQEYQRIWLTGYFEGYNAGMWYAIFQTQDPLRYLKELGVSYFISVSISEIAIKIPYFDVDTSNLPRKDSPVPIKGGITIFEKTPYFAIDGFGPKRPLRRNGIDIESMVETFKQKWTWISNAKNADGVIE